MEFLTLDTLWWHWIVLGIILLVLEMSTGTFVMLIFGASAILVGVVDYYLPISFSVELSVWMLMSLLVLAIWYKWFRGEDLSNSGQSNHRLDTEGTVTKSIRLHSRGKVVFDTPVLGDTLWRATSSQNIDKDARVKIVKVNGQLIEVELVQ